MIDFDEALALVAGAAKPLGAESVPLGQARGRVLAAPVTARIESPRADVSVMDGYAVRSADLPGRLAVIGEASPGNPAGALAPGACMRIFTGAAVPAGADRVVIQEEVAREGELARFGAPGPARHIRTRGSDFERGEVLLDAGRQLDARALVAAAAADVAEVEVWRRPRIVLLATGDELAEPGTARDRPDSIPDSLSPGVAALVSDWGGEIVAALRLKDDLPAMEKTAADALRSADLVIVTGGASVGEKDHGKAMFEAAGLELIFSRVAIKPGKPIWLGRVGTRLVIGLPGNPTSAMVTARLLLAPLLAGLTGREPVLNWRSALLAEAAAPCGERETFVRGAWAGDAVRPLTNQDSGAQRMLADAQVLIRRRAGAAAAQPGEAVEIICF